MTANGVLHGIYIYNQHYEIGVAEMGDTPM